jgi:hypothetical protein
MAAVEAGALAEAGIAVVVDFLVAAVFAEAASVAASAVAA